MSIDNLIEIVENGTNDIDVHESAWMEIVTILKEIRDGSFNIKNYERGNE